MEFQSYIYVFAFLPVVFGLYLFTRKMWLSTLVLIAASFVFYGYQTYWYSFPLVISAVVDFYIGKRIFQSESRRVRLTFLWLSIAVNLSILGFFKYTTWITESLALLAESWGLGVKIPVVDVPLPPGVSFYTFQTMSYTLDIYHRRFEPRDRFSHYLNFVCFFPQLVAGPIERARDLLPQLEKIRGMVSPEILSQACFMILWGLFLKLVVADNMGGIVEWIETQLRRDQINTDGFGLIFMYAAAFQIYGDFLAYTTIARGTALFFNVQLSLNFLTPYLASNPSDFWRRWHITLSSWVRDYLYIPLGGNRVGPVKSLGNLIVTMLLLGLWHGAGLLFILWGVYHGLLLVIYHVFKIDTWLIQRAGRLGKIIAMVLMFHLVCFGWILFRGQTDYLPQLFSSIAATPLAWFNPFGSDFPLYQTSQLGVIATSFFLYALPVVAADVIAYRRNCEFTDLFVEMPIWLKSALILLVCYSLFFFASRYPDEFIYFRF